MALLDSLFRTPEVSAGLSDSARLQGMLDFEAALARAETSCGVIPAQAATAISTKCRAELFDSATLQKSAASAGNLAIPMLEQLVALVAREDAGAAGFVHWGATSQDAIDTGFVLQVRAVLDGMFGEVRELCDTLAALANAHRGTLMVGRTWMQHATPTTFGVKVAGWLDALLRQQTRFNNLRGRVLVLQFGGAVGTLATLRENAHAVSAALAKELSLALPAMPWHTQRDRFGELATTMGLLTGTLGKIARDISLHGQTEIGELREAADKGHGGSSSMPHKRNPVSCAVILSAAVRMPGLVSSALSAMVQEDERGLGGWQAEWEMLPEILGLAAGALHHLKILVAGLEIDTTRMRENLEATRGLIYAEAVTVSLAAKIGKKEARLAVERACDEAAAEHKHLREVLLGTPAILQYFSTAELSQLFDARQHLGLSDSLIDGVLGSSAAMWVDPIRGNR
jgi:3-carboxy-cis,cis-muconate cycloisomerase